MKQKPWPKKTIIVLISLLIAISVFLLGLELLNANKVAWGTKVVGVNLGGKNLEQAQVILADQLDKYHQQQIELVFTEKNLSWQPSLKQLGLTFDFAATVKNAWQIGRGENILQGLWQQILAFFGHYNLAIVTNLNQQELALYTTDNFSAIEDPAISATLVYNPAKNDFEVQPERTGIATDKEQLAQQLTEQTSRLSFNPIKLSLAEDKPLVFQAAALETYQQVQNILSKAPYSFFYQDKKWPISEKNLITWLAFEPKPDNSLLIEFNQEEVTPYLISLAPEINQPYVNAFLSAEDNRTIIKEPSQPAIEIDFLKTTDQLSLIAFSNQLEIPIITKEEPAPIRQDTLEQLGITDFLGQGVSNWRGSSYSRTTNIKIGVSKLNGLFLDPGQEFKFNEMLGEVTAQDGYLPEMVIKENKLVPEYGGGLCQVSTTMFRAAINAGLEITERAAHAFAVSYYNPQGFDATIYPPHPDLRFINDTPGNLLIQGYTSGTLAFFEFYGQTDDRRVEIQGPFIYQSGGDGSMKTVLTQQIYQGEEMIREDKFWSNYRSPALFPVEKNPLE